MLNHGQVLANGVIQCEQTFFQQLQDERCREQLRHARLLEQVRRIQSNMGMDIRLARHAVPEPITRK